MNKYLLKFFMKIGRNLFKNEITRPLSYALADFYIGRTLGENGIFEFQGFKVKKGRTTRIAILEGTSEPFTIFLMKNKVKPAMNVIDIGANIGLFTLILAKLVGKSGHVYSFEPDPQLFQILNENVKLNQLENVSTFQLAVSNKIGKAKFSQNFSQDGDGRLESNSMLKNIING